MKIQLDRKTLTVALLLLCASCASTRSHIPHPPTYNDFVKFQAPNYDELNADFFLKRIDLICCISDCDKNSEKIDDKKVAEIKKKCIKNEEDKRIMEELLLNMQFKEAFQFTANEMNAIKQSGDLNKIVGAGIQSDLDQILGTELLELASAADPAMGLALISLVDRYFALSKGTPQSPLTKKLEANIMKLQRTDSDNALAYYLSGYRLQQDKKFDEALLQIKEGNTKMRFSNYYRERFFAVVKAAESLGYSQFTARQHAIDYSTPAEIYSKLVDMCKQLIATNQKEDARKECVSMGEKIETASHNTVEKIQGLIIQSLAYRESDGLQDVELLRRISDKERAALENSPKLLKIPFKDIPEAVWLKYFELYFQTDERVAGSFIEEYYAKTKHDNGK